MNHSVLRLLVSIILLLGLAAGSPAARAEPAAERDARMQWWREARFGMFVHWGLYSGLAGTWEGKAVATKGGMEWIQQRVSGRREVRCHAPRRERDHHAPAAGAGCNRERGRA